MVDWVGEGKVMPDFNSLGVGHHSPKELPDWADRQRKVFTNWINNKVAVRMLKVHDLFTDLQDGVVLYNLLEVLSRHSLASLGKVKPEKNKIKKIANMNIVWKYLSTTVHMVGIGPTDIEDGNVTLTLGMIWSLIVFFMAKDLGDGGHDLATLKKRIMDWVKQRTKGYPDLHVTNFTDSFADGRAFMALLNNSNPAQCPYTPSANPCDNLRRAFKDAETLYSVGSILDPDDELCCSDEKANITYLAELMKAMPEVARVMSQADKIKVATTAADQSADATLEKIKELCRFKPEEGKDCAQKVAEFMEAAGLQGVHVVAPGSQKEDPSGLMAPFIVGESAGPAGAPTVLLYASYGTGEDSPEVAAKWASDPFVAEMDSDRLKAKGAFADKANVVACLAAVEALLKSDEAKKLPVGVKVVIGATPPAGLMAGEGPTAVSDALAEFLRAHSGDIGAPDFVVVSEPGGSALAPEKAAVLYGCRGFATLDMTVNTFVQEAGHKRGCAQYGGPLLDPGFVLATILASTRDPKTGAMQVDALHRTPDLVACERLKELHYGEHHMRTETGYHPEVPCARDSYHRGEVSVHATVAEQLTLLPAVTVVALSMGSGTATGPLSSEFAASARATVHLCLAPDQDAALAIRGFQAHCTKMAPFGVEVKFENAKGHSGWFTHPSLPIVDALTSSRVNADSRRETVVVACPQFKPVPTAFAQALQTSKVLATGINDTKANGGGANEAVCLADIKDFVKNTVTMLYHIATPPKSAVVTENALDEKTQYATKFMEDVDKRNAANKLRARSPTPPTSGIQTPASGHHSPAVTPPRMGAGAVGFNAAHSHLITSLKDTLDTRAKSLSPRNKDGQQGYMEGRVTGPNHAVPPPLPPGSGGPDSDATAEEVLDEINQVRTDPAGYAAKLEGLLEYYKGSTYTLPGQGAVMTTEGETPVKEAIAALKAMKPLAPLARVDGMDRASLDHARDLRDSGRLGHVGSDGSKASDRIDRYGKFMQVAGSLYTCQERSAQGIVAQLLISDGERTRQNRKWILGDHFKVCGIAIESHPTAEKVCVITLAGGFGAKPLDHPTVVTSTGGQISADFQRVMDSIPVPQLLEEVMRGIDAGHDVELDYKPAEVKMTVTRLNGSKQILKCTWV